VGNEMRQSSPAGFEKHIQKTRKEQFLEEMVQIIQGIEAS
jgi:hypothetical protein